MLEKRSDFDQKGGLKQKHLDNEQPTGTGSLETRDKVPNVDISQAVDSIQAALAADEAEREREREREAEAERTRRRQSSCCFSD